MEDLVSKLVERELAYLRQCAAQEEAATGGATPRVALDELCCLAPGHVGMCPGAVPAAARVSPPFAAFGRAVGFLVGVARLYEVAANYEWLAGCGSPPDTVAVYIYDSYPRQASALAGFACPWRALADCAEDLAQARLSRVPVGWWQAAVPCAFADAGVEQQ